MKALLTILTIFTLSTAAFAHPPQGQHHGKKKFAKVVVKGKKAQAIYEALDVEVITKDRPMFIADVKKVSTLRCVKLISKEDTSVEKFKCISKGKKVKKGHGRRGRNGRVGRGHKNL